MRDTVRIRLLAGAALLTVLGCGDGDGTGPGSLQGSLRVIQASLNTAALDVLVDGTVRVTGLGAGTMSVAIPLATGPRTIEVGPSGEGKSPTALRLVVAADSQYTAVVFDSSSVLNPVAVTDTGAVPAAGMTKLQVINLARLAGPIDVYRRQPDFDGLIDLMFPFEYRAASGYVQSAPGDWQVLVATEARVGGVPPEVPEDTLLIVGPVSLTADQAATVVLVDDPNDGIGAVVVRER
ncbi:MAG TPA: DUF4397 domain-containing protein [Gemmatimonadales bacterium]|nr:DUF4397 domain-containing protein [Gemmatimonadales bacterium]